MIKKMNQYGFDEQLEVGEKASIDVEAYLNSKPETIRVENVENDKEYQKKDIDLIWHFKHNGEIKVRNIEVKGDTYSRSGNFFLETISNVERNNPGCFMYSEADYFFYYFIDTGELNSIPMKKSRRWFIENKERFKERPVSTNVGNSGEYYTSRGRLVPKIVMRKEVGTKYKVIPRIHAEQEKIAS